MLGLLVLAGRSQAIASAGSKDTTFAQKSLMVLCCAIQQAVKSRGRVYFGLQVLAVIYFYKLVENTDVGIFGEGDGR